MIPDAELLSLACEFDLGRFPIAGGRLSKQFPDDYDHVYVKNMGNPDGGPDRWAILRHSGSVCLGKDGLWERQGMPSGREDNFYQRCRYTSVHEANEYYRRWEKAILEWAEEKGDAVLNYPDCPTERLKF